MGEGTATRLARWFTYRLQRGVYGETGRQFRVIARFNGDWHGPYKLFGLYLQPVESPADCLPGGWGATPIWLADTRDLADEKLRFGGSFLPWLTTQGGGRMNP